MRTIAKHFPFRAIRAGAAVLAMLAASSAFAAQIFVAGSDPKADDKNPGTRGAALPDDPGGRGQGPGRRHDLGQTGRLRGGAPAQEFRQHGNPDYALRVEGRPRADRLDAARRTGGGPMEARREIQELRREAPRRPAQGPHGGPRRQADRHGTKGHPAAGRQGQVGHVPRLRPHADAQPGRRRSGRAHDPAFARHGLLLPASQIRLLGVQEARIRLAHLGLCLDGNCNLVEDCYFHDLYHGCVGIRGGLCTVRRCNFYRACSSVNPGGNANIVEDCLVVSAGRTGRTSSPTGAGTSRANPSAASSPRAGG